MALPSFMKHVAVLTDAGLIARMHPGRVLVTTFVRTLPDVLSTLFRRLAPEVADRVDFAGIYTIATGLLRARGITVKLDAAAATLAWNTTWACDGLPGEVGAIDRDGRYWQEALSAVIGPMTARAVDSDRRETSLG